MSPAPKLLTPCHGVPIYIFVSGYTEEVEVMCAADGCYNSWDKHGEPS